MKPQSELHTKGQRMIAPRGITEAERVAMNQAARDYAWDSYNKGVMLAVQALRDGIADGYRPTHSELVALCDMLEEKTREAAPCGMNQ